MKFKNSSSSSLSFLVLEKACAKVPALSQKNKYNNFNTFEMLSLSDFIIESGVGTT